jgi:hypothetical protein
MVYRTWVYAADARSTSKLETHHRPTLVTRGKRGALGCGQIPQKRTELQAIGHTARVPLLTSELAHTAMTVCAHALAVPVGGGGCWVRASRSGVGDVEEQYR